MKKVKASAKHFGWKPDLPDHRDHMYAAPAHITTKLPSSVDLRKLCPPVYDQGQLGSCTANSIAAAVQFEQMKQKKKSFVPSRLFIYYNERSMEHTIDQDSGAEIRDGIKSVNKIGVCPETLWTYDDGKKKFMQKPPAPCYTAAAQNQVVSYQRLVQSLVQMKGCLASGYPFVFGFTVFDNIYSDKVTKTGQLDLPGPKDAREGGHAVMAVGYDDSTQRFIIRNSWGPDWAMKGYFTMPYAYVTDSNYSDDFWTIRMVE
ncbi:MAG: C1 family peptidase [Bacteroidia bacterium]